MSTAVTPVPEQGAPLSQIERVTNVFFAPSKTFTDIRRSANWLLPIVVIGLFSLAFVATVGAKIGWDHVSETQMRFAPAIAQQQIESLPADQKASALQKTVVRTKWSSYFFTVLRLIGWAIVALVLWLTFSFGLGKEISYGKSLAIIVYASLPGIIKAVLGIAVILAGMDPDAFIIQNPVGTNAGYYLNLATTPRFLYAIASEVDLFMIWVLILTGIGFSVVAGVKRGTAMSVVFGWWALVTLVSAGIAAAFS
ncbi:MAG: hypothetical protein JWO20_3104 [Candidatus Angelobacter sp.]|nr:hypothetical protein [Candidatus Angelobacter sp.]